MGTAKNEKESTGGQNLDMTDHAKTSRFYRLSTWTGRTGQMGFLHLQIFGQRFLFTVTDKEYGPLR